MNFQMKLDVRAIFWSDSGGWQGTALELDASASGALMHEVVSRLIAAASDSGEADVQRGSVPGRLVPLELEQRWADINQRGGTHPLHSIVKNAVECTEVATKLTVTLRGSRSDVAEADPINVRVLVMREDDTWISQCLEYDLGGEGETQDDAMSTAMRAIVHQVALDRVLGKVPLKELPKAPAKFWSFYDSGATVEWSSDSNEVRPSFRVAS